MSKKTSKNSKAKNSSTSVTAQPAKAVATLAPSLKVAGQSAAATPKAAPTKAGATKTERTRAEVRGAARTAPAAPAPSAKPPSAAEPATPRPIPDAARDPRLPAIGTVLVKRDRLGRARCECAIEAEGFRYRGTLHRSLSAAASAAAADLGIKSRVNGFVFWTVVKAARPAKDQVEHLRKIAARYEEQAAALLSQASAAEVGSDVRRNLETHVAQVRDLIAKAAA